MKRFFVIAMLLFALPAHAQTAAPVKIVVLGDSLTSGYMLQPGEDFGTILERRLVTMKYNAKVINMSVAGATTGDGFAKIDQVIQAKPDLVIIALGMNDALRGLDVEKVIYYNIHKIRHMLFEAKILYMVVGVKAPSNRDEAYAKALASAYYSIAEFHRVPLVADILKPLYGKPELTLADGLHPSAKGVRLMVEHVLPKITYYVSWGMYRKAQPGVQ